MEAQAEADRRETREMFDTMSESMRGMFDSMAEEMRDGSNKLIVSNEVTRDLAS